MNRWSAYQMIVIKHQQTILFHNWEGIEQAHHNSLKRGLWRGKEGNDLGLKSRRKAIECGKNVAPEAVRIVVSRIQRNPGERARLMRRALLPLLQQCGFPKTGRSTDQHKPGPETFIEPFDQAWT